jgi:hypothetical protein
MQTAKGAGRFEMGVPISGWTIRGSDPRWCDHAVANRQQSTTTINIVPAAQLDFLQLVIMNSQFCPVLRQIVEAAISGLRRRIRIYRSDGADPQSFCWTRRRHYEVFLNVAFIRSTGFHGILIHAI